MADYKVDPKAGVPYLVVLDGDGKVLCNQETSSLEEGDHHDVKKVQAFLDTHPLAELPTHEPGFRGRCLEQLRAARGHGLLGAAVPRPHDLARAAGAFRQRGTSVRASRSS